MPLSNQLVRARESIGYSQDDAAAALGINRAMVSYWESDRRTPNDRQLVALARIYRVSIAQLQSDNDLFPRPDLAQMMLRSDVGVPPEARPGIEEFISFLDNYAKLAGEIGASIHGLESSPFINRSEFTTGDDARRKAEDVRGRLRLGIGPIADIDWVCELLGITVYRAELGADLSSVPSGAFVKHPDVGFAILVNLSMTPGRRRFTVAHEIAHALFHSNDKENNYVISLPTKDPKERFADVFAGEFLMPTEGIRGFMEENGMGRTISDASEVVHIQRYFKVSFPTALVRLRQAKYLSAANFEVFQRVRPIVLAQTLGYEIDREELIQNPYLWRIARFPRRFIQMLRNALISNAISVSTAAALTDLTIDEIAGILEPPVMRDALPEMAKEFAEYGQSVTV